MADRALEAALDELASPAGARPAGGARGRADADRAADDRHLAATSGQGDGRRRGGAAGGRVACPGRDRASVTGTVRRGRPRLRIASVRDRRRASIAPGVTSSCSCCNTGSTRRWPRPAPARSTPVRRPIDEAGRVRAALSARRRSRGGTAQAFTSAPSTTRRWPPAVPDRSDPRSSSAARSACSVPGWRRRCDALTTIDGSPTAVARRADSARRVPRRDAVVGEIPGAIEPAAMISWSPRRSSTTSTTTPCRRRSRGCSEVLVAGGPDGRRALAAAGPERPQTAAAVHAQLRSLPWLRCRLPIAAPPIICSTCWSADERARRTADHRRRAGRAGRRRAYRGLRDEGEIAIVTDEHRMPYSGRR